MEDKIKKLYDRKVFFKTLYAEAFDGHNDLTDNQQFRLFQKKDDFTKITFYSNVDDMNNYIENNKYSSNLYFSLATTNGKGGAEDNLLYRYFLAWDFDKKLDKELNSYELMFRFKNLGLWYHALVDSGNGYHAYMCINKTNNLDKVEAVTKAIGKLLKADPESMLKTQVLRVPLSMNLKDKPKQANIIKLYEEKTIKPYDINDLYNTYCGFTSHSTNDRTIKYAINSTEFPPCIINILKGVCEGDRNFCLKRLISFLKIFRYKESEARNIIIEWNNKNNPPLSKKEIEYQFKYIWDKEYRCFGCNTDDNNLQGLIEKYCKKEKCTNIHQNEILLIDGEIIEMEYKLCKKLEPQRKDILQLKGNHLLIICILKNNPEGMRTNKIIDELTYNGKCSLSHTILDKVLKELIQNSYITKIHKNQENDEDDMYKINPIKCKDIDKFSLSYFAVLGVIKGNITSEDFKIYCYLRYRKNRGLNLVQEKIADELGMTQQSISKHIKRLTNEKYLEVVHEKNKDSHQYDINIYKINY